ncbi:MAG: hypothetical protein AAGJ52_14770 [Pseudomonadota bacterium]
MNSRAVATLLLIALLTGCASTERSAMFSPESGWITPQEAIFSAAEAAPSGIRGTFAITVQATGKRGDVLYLNSELDYRDQRSLNTAVAPVAVEQLSEQLGGDPAEVLIGEDILIRGTARRMRILFMNPDGQPSGSYYFQTQVGVIDADQISLR